VYKGVTLAYGRKSGPGSYGPDGIKCGARIIEITAFPFTFNTWIRNEDGEVEDLPKRNSGGSFIKSCCK
jgi:hypothetical protein